MKTSDALNGGDFTSIEFLMTATALSMMMLQEEEEGIEGGHYI